MIQAVLFDMDGLMFGTEQLFVDGFLAAGRELNIPVTESLLARLRGTGIAECRKIFNDTIPGELYDTARALCVQRVEEGIRTRGVPVKPGLYALLKWLKEHQIPAVLATSTARERAMDLVDRAGVREYFSSFVFGTEMPRPKPFPDIFLAAAKSVGADPMHCLVLEDSHNGLRAAKAAGCIALAVPDLDPAPEASLGLWDYQRESLDQVIPILEELTRIHK